MSEPTCAQCGTDQDVKAVPPDLDIRPVPLCLPCRVRIFYGGAEDTNVAAGDIRLMPDPYRRTRP